MGSALATSGGVYRLGEPEFQEGCSTAACGAADLLSSQAVLAATVTVTFLAVIALTFLHSAREECDEEQSRVAAELSALERFERRVGGLSAGSGQSGPGGAGGATLVRADAADAPPKLRAVRRAYEETVMAVPHYEEDYGEPLETHMRAEFGDEVAAAVTGGSALTPPVKQALLQRAAASREERTSFLRTLSTEGDSLAAATDDLAAIDRRVDRIENQRRLQQSFPELTETWEELGELEEECRETLERRQEQVQRGGSGADWRDDGHSLCAYLYGPLPVDYPALADGALLLDRIRTTRRRVADALTRRV